MKYEVISRPHSGIQYPKIISLDTEYTELDIKKARLRSISIGVSPDLTYILESFKAVQHFIDSAEIVYTWNMVVDQLMVEKSGFTFPKSKILDGMLMEHLIDENLDHGLGDFALREYNDNYKSEFWKKYQAYQDAPKEDSYPYEMRDGCYTYIAGVKYSEALKDRWALVEHTHKLQWALFETTIRGIAVDVPLMEKTKQEMGEKIQGYLPALRENFKSACQVYELQKWAEEINKRKKPDARARVPRPEFNFSSDSQIRWLLFDHLGLQAKEKTKKGSPKVDYDCIKSLSEEEPLLKPLVKYKEIKNIYATFVEGLQDKVESNRIFPVFNINGTTTGRISHSNPNMGNIPTDGSIRSFFIPEPTNCIVGADYSQLEVVVEANLTEDPQLLRIINEGASKHDITAEGLGLPRDTAKTLNFALQYGAGVHKISKLLGTSVSASQEIFEAYWKLYAGVKNLKDKTEKEIKEKGQVTNLFGRTRHFPEPKNHWDAERQYRQGYNFLIQGVGADCTNMATYRVHEYLKSNNLGKLWFSVHDEIIAECDIRYTDQCKDAIVNIMEGISNELHFKYSLRAKSYGGFPSWRKA